MGRAGHGHVTSCLQPCDLLQSSLSSGLLLLPLLFSPSASLSSGLLSQPLGGKSREAEGWGKERGHLCELPAHPQGVLLRPECHNPPPLPTRGLLTT